MAVVLGSEPACGQSYELWDGDDFELEASAHRGLRLKSEDPEIELRLGGRLHWDAAWFDEDSQPDRDDEINIPDDTELRRGRIYLAGELFDDWSFKIERELAGPNDTWRNVWIGWEPIRHLELRAGNFIAPFCLEEVGSSNYSTFLERALPSAFAPSYQTGVAIRTRGRLGDDANANRWSWATAGYIEPLGKFEDDRHGTEHWGIASRVTFAPLVKGRRVVHLGASVDYRNIDQGSHGNEYNISSRPENSLADTLLDLEGLPDVDEVLSLGAEAGMVLGPFSAQGEYIWSTLRRGGLDDDGDPRRNASFDGWYVQAGYVLTGEHRRYSASSGTFQGVRPKRKWGAVEVAVRYSTLDLDESGLSGGSAKDWTIGLNWWLRENVRVMFNFIRVDGTTETGVHDDPLIYAARFLVFF